MARLTPVLAALAAALVISACGPGAAPAPAASGSASAIALVVTGAGGTRPVEGGLFERFGVAGPARTFSAADLAALPRYDIETGYPLGDPARTWRGVRLSDVLAAAGAGGRGARITCLDGYQVEIGAAMIAAHEPVLASSVDAEALVLGELGPFLLVWPRGTAPDLADMTDDLWAWGVFAIEAL